MITIEVVYANPQQQALIKLEIEQGASVRTAIEKSGLLKQFYEIDLQRFKVGIFSKIVTLDTPVQTGDRVEIYHPLLIDPKAARLKRAKQQKN